MKKALKVISLLLVVSLFMIIAMGSGSSSSSSTPTKVGTVSEGIETTTEAEETLQDIYYVGDILSAKNMKVVYVASGEYKSTNQYLQPNEGNKYIYIELYAENESDSDVAITYFDFEAYADGYAVEQFFGEDEDALSATLSKGRYTTGRVYFEVPKDASEIEIEYEVNWFSDQKVKFAYEGEKNSGFTPSPITTRTDNAFVSGDIVEAGDLKITYLSCSDYKSNNQFIQPASGNKYISLEFEFENTGSSDEYISSYSFYCFADGASCNGMYMRDDDLSATISAGRKAKGSVSFEVPKDAQVIEVEYETNVWTSSRVVFTVQ